MSAPYSITGAMYQETHPRLEIRDLHQKHEQFTLFILAWSEIMKPEYRPVAAQFGEIAGIHGMPYVRWPGDPDEKNQDDRGAWLGYCNHASILFPHWHRPYIMLLEQSISEAAQGIAGAFAKQNPSEAGTWLQAARELRFPFWDWTLPITGKEGLPEILYQPELSLHMPGGQVASHENILAYYRFNAPVEGFNDRLEYKDMKAIVHHDKKEQVVSYFKQWKRTYRWPEPTPIDPTENIQVLNEELTDKTLPPAVGSWANLTSDVSSFFTFPIDVPRDLHANAWDEFSNTTFQSARPDKHGKQYSPYVWHSAPLEQPHNHVHLVVGGPGHMGDNDTAGFDPIFFLHHCNVDRLLAFWEHIYPEYVPGNDGYLDVDGITRGKFTQSGGSFLESSDQVVDENTSLFPFRKGDNTYWSSKDAHSLHHDEDTTKYYTYPPIENVVPDKKASREHRNIQRAILQKHFGFDPIKLRQSAPLVKQRLFSDVAHSALPHGHEPVHNYRHFVISTSLSATAVGGSYSVKVFLSIKGVETQVGSVSVLGRGKSSSCGNCQSRRAVGTRVRGVILIPHGTVVGLLEHHDINNEAAEDQHVIDAFKKNLRVRLVSPSGWVHGQTSSEHPGSGDLLLPDDTIPYLRLHSANISALKDDGIPHDTTGPQDIPPKTPYEFYDWKDHDSLVSGHWVKNSGQN